MDSLIIGLYYDNNIIPLSEKHLNFSLSSHLSNVLLNTTINLPVNIASGDYYIKALINNQYDINRNNTLKDNILLYFFYTRTSPTYRLNEAVFDSINHTRIIDGFPVKLISGKVMILLTQNF